MRGVGYVVVAVLLAASVGGCGRVNTVVTTGPLPSWAVTPSVSHIGPGCSAVPVDPTNSGSFESMRSRPLASAIAGNGDLSVLASGLREAGLAPMLDTASELTVFAPINAAFAKKPVDWRKSVMGNRASLTRLLKQHMVPRWLAPEQLPGTHNTLARTTLTVTNKNGMLTVNGARVICGNVLTANAVVYIVDAVLASD